MGFWTILIWVTKKDKTCKLICGMVKKKTALLQWFLLNKLHFILSMQHWVKKTSQKLSLHSEKLKSKHLSFISCHKSIYFLFFLVGMWEKKRDFFFLKEIFSNKTVSNHPAGFNCSVEFSVTGKQWRYLQHIQCYSVHVSVMHSMQEVSWPFYYNTLSLSQPPS